MLNSELLCHMALAMVTPTDHSGRGDGNSGPRSGTTAQRTTRCVTMRERGGEWREGQTTVEL